ncbi:MAG: hypothetical protein QXY15_09280 [Candidatus Nitrosotenuis sp.]
MLVVSQNLTNYKVPIPENAVYRINLAWINDLTELKNLLEKHHTHEIFLDLPINRTKPPANNYSLNELIPILQTYKNVRYFAISNVNSKGDLDDYLQIVPQEITLVPKIESPEGIVNIKEITDSLRTQKIIMLDHDDLYSALIKKGELPSKFKEYVNELIMFCNKNNVTILRTIGVLFSDEEKRVTQYIK